MRDVSLRTKLRLVWYRIFNFYFLLNFGRKNILGVVWKEYHEFVSYYLGVPHLLSGKVAFLFVTIQDKCEKFLWLKELLRQDTGPERVFTEGHSSVHSGSQPSSQASGWSCLGLWCVTEAPCHKQEQRRQAHSLCSFSLNFPLSKASPVSVSASM